MNWESEQQLYVDESEQLTSPHFDDEATLVSARKVVPLDEVGQKPFVKSKLAQRVSLAMVGVLGLLVAIGLYSYIHPESDVSQSELSAKTASGSVGGKAEGGVLETVAQSDSDSNAPDNKDTKDRTLNKSAAHSSERVRVKDKIVATPLPRVSPAQDEQSDMDEMQALREIRREVRRQERQTIRERRRRESRDGIFRVPDLFEGRNRP
jgi:hypothetical protein